MLKVQLYRLILNIVFKAVAHTYNVDEFHVIMVCSVFDDIRLRLWYRSVNLTEILRTYRYKNNSLRLC